MVRQKWKRHLSFEQLDTRIALNGDMHPLRSVGLELTGENHPSSIAVRGIVLSDIAAMVAIRQVEIQQVATPRQLPSYQVIRFNPMPFLGKLIGEGEGKAESDRNAPPPTNHGPGSPFAEGEFTGKPSLPVRSVDSKTSPATPINGLQSGPKQDVQLTTSIPRQNQDTLRQDAAVQRPLSIQSESSSIIVSPAIRTSSASPLSDFFSSKPDFHAASIAVQATAPQSKSAWNEFASSVPMLSRAFIQTGITVGPKLESAKPMEDGMFSFSMVVGDLRSQMQLSEVERYEEARERSKDRSESHLRETQRAQIHSESDDFVVHSRRLPVPKGMIEIRGQSENNMQRPGAVARASSNPFEIIQLFIGSTNMVQSRSELEMQGAFLSGIGVDSKESTELATREDILVTLGIGAVLAIAIRENRFRCQTESMFATVRRPFAQAT